MALLLFGMLGCAEPCTFGQACVEHQHAGMHIDATFSPDETGAILSSIGEWHNATHQLVSISTVIAA